MRIRHTIAGALALVAAHLPHAQAHAAGCGRYHGRAYIICAESGPENMPDGLPAGRPHPGPSSASGPCGMVAESRRNYGGDTLAACTRYMADRYGTWAHAEHVHRAQGWW